MNDKEIVFADLKPGDLMPRHCFDANGRIIVSECMKTICPELTDEEADQIAALIRDQPRMLEPTRAVIRAELPKIRAKKA